MIALILSIVISSLQLSIDSMEQAGRYDEAIQQSLQLIEACPEENTVDRIRSEVDIAYYYSIIGNMAQATQYSLRAISEAKTYISGNMPFWVQTKDYEAIYDAADLLQDIVHQTFGALSDCYAAASEDTREQFMADLDIASFAASAQRMYRQMPLDYLKQVYCAIWCEAVLLEAQCAPDVAQVRAHLLELVETPEVEPTYSLKASIRLAVSYAQEGQYDSAHIWMDRVAGLDTAAVYAEVLRENTAWIAVQRNDWTTALPLLKQSLNNKRVDLKSEFLWMTAQSRRRNWVNNYAWYFHQNISLCALAPHPDSVNAFIYDNVLVEKGILLSTETELEVLLREKGERAILDSLYALRRLQHQSQSRDRNATQQLELQILRQSHTVGDFTRLMDLSYNDIQRALQDNDVVVEFIVTEDADDQQYMQALVMRKQWTYPRLVTIGTNEEVTRLCTKPGLYFDTKASAFIWKPILQAADIQAGETVYFAPDGIFYLTGIEYLATDSACMFDTYNLIRLSSSRELCRRWEKSDNQTAVLYGGIRYSSSENNDEIEYLPATLLEVQSIDSILTSDDLYTGYDATEESFVAFSGHSPRLIHVATHGFYIKHKRVDHMVQKNVQFVRLTERQKINIEDYALVRCGLLMANSATSWTGTPQGTEVYDGIMTAREIATLDLHNTEIVVLSACKTGLGEVTVDGIAGLQRGFKKAGVHAMMMSLWAVDDTATLLFMRAFYRHIVEGDTKQNALRKAQQVLRSMDEYNHPRYWAAFVLLDAI